MSTQAMTSAFKHSGSKGSARLMLLAMADEANDQGLLTAYRRSQSWLAKKANISARTASRSISELVELGELVIINRGNGRDSSDYLIILPGLEPHDLQIEGCQIDTPGQIEGCQIDTPGVPDCLPRGVRMTTQGCQDDPPIIPFSPVLSRSSPKHTQPDLFDVFWLAYPRRTAKGSARTAWNKATKKTDPETIIAGAETFAAFTSREKTEARFIPHPATWLNQTRWEDEIAPTAVSVIDEDRDAPSGRIQL